MANPPVNKTTYAHTDTTNPKWEDRKDPFAIRGARLHIEKYLRDVRTDMDCDTRLEVGIHPLPDKHMIKMPYKFYKKLLTHTVLEAWLWTWKNCVSLEGNQARHANIEAALDKHMRLGRLKVPDNTIPKRVRESDRPKRDEPEPEPEPEPVPVRGGEKPKRARWNEGEGPIVTRRPRSDPAAEESSEEQEMPEEPEMPEAPPPPDVEAKPETAPDIPDIADEPIAEVDDESGTAMAAFIERWEKERYGN
jgi:hypothetical protein